MHLKRFKNNYSISLFKRQKKTIAYVANTAHINNHGLKN